ncbi:MAG: alpha,2-glucosyltransferase [Candidatus Peribacteria bacterium]|nr:alpha,2-glucosyltransferase [Candidatus Peribacteria bacterium]
MSQHSLISDENFHFDQISRFTKYNWSMVPSLTTLPGYHGIVAAVWWLSGFSATLPVFRSISFGISLFSILAFFLCVRFLDPEHALLKTMQYILLPVLFPFLFLLYTDISSLLFLFLALYAVLTRHYWLAGILSILCVLTRQNAIVWLGFLFLLVWIHHSVTPSLPGETYFQEARRRVREVLKSRQVLWRAVFRSFTFLVGMVLFAVFVYWNHGIAIGDKEAHPFPAIHFGNIYLLLFLFFFIFLPLNIANLPRIRRLLKVHMDSVLVLLVLFFFFYWFTFQNTHPFNQQDYSWWLRNRILIFFTQSALLRVLFFLPIAYSVLSIAATRLVWSSFYSMYPLAVLYLIPSWLIEQRYYFIPYCLFMIFREGRSFRVESLTVVYFAVCTVVLYWGIILGRFFL